MLNSTKENYMNSGNLEAAASTQDQIYELVNVVPDGVTSRVVNTSVVDEETIAQVLSVWTGIPVSRISEEETTKLLHLEDELHKRVVGENEAVAALGRALRRTRSGLSDPKRPGGSFIFLGPTGVGKSGSPRPSLACSLMMLMLSYNLT